MIVIDTSAVVAILRDEAERRQACGEPEFRGQLFIRIGQAMDAALLCKGHDFSRTDIEAAVKGR